MSAKAKEDELVESIANRFNTYLKKGASLDSFDQGFDPDLNIDGLDKLLRIHFLLTKNNDGRPGIIDFVDGLEERIRNIKTSVTTETNVSRSGIDGRINWSRTFDERTRRGNDRTVYACSSSKKKYGIKENLVLKKLLSVVKSILEDELSDGSEKNQWLSDWFKSGRNLAERVQKIYNKNVYLNSQIQTQFLLLIYQSQNYYNHP